MLSHTDHRLPYAKWLWTMDHRLWTSFNAKWPWTVVYRLWTSSNGHGPSTMDFFQRKVAMDHRLWTIVHGPWTIDLL